MTRPAADGLRVLGCDAGSGRPLPPLSWDIAEKAAREYLARARPPRYGICTEKLESAGWAVVFIGGVDREVKEALEPLLSWRRREAGERYMELEAKVDETAAGWRTALFGAYGRVEPRQIPWYLLLVSRSGALSFHFEHDLRPTHAVGRLSFASADDFAAYAERIAANEKSGETKRPKEDHGARVGLWAPSHAADVATELCVEHFARPLAAAALTHIDGSGRADVDVEQALDQAATKARLGAMIARSPDLLVTAGHGLLYAPESPWQLRRQGALVCADWPGPEAAPRPIRAEESFAAADLPEGALPGAMAIMLGCYTAGTPDIDPYESLDIAAADRLTRQPFASAMAGRLLGAEGGATAFLGHVGRTFEAGFYWRGARQSGAFEDAVRALLDGRRLGVALDGLGHRHADLAVAWTRPQLSADSSESDPLDLWVAMNDARAWTLFGDPASRLWRR